MKLSSNKISENIEDLILFLRSRLDTLQSQHVSFVSFCSNLINCHIFNIQKELTNQTAKSIQQGVTRCLETLKASYEKITSDLEFSYSTKNVQEAISRTQKQIISLSKQNLPVFEFEEKISVHFASLSEVVNRKILKTQSESRKSLTSTEPDVRNKKPSLATFQKESKDFKEKIETLELRVISLSQDILLKNKEIEGKEKELEIKEKELLILTQGIDSNRIKKKNCSDVRLKLNDSNRINSNLLSPVTSPVNGEKKRQSQFLSLQASPERLLDIEKFRSKIEILNVLLEKFSLFTMKVDEVVSSKPELADLFSNFKLVKSELSFALKEIASPKPPTKKKRDEKSIDTGKSSELSSLKSENSKLKNEVSSVLSEVLDLRDQTKKTESELREARRASISLKQEILRLEKEKEEVQLESIYVKTQLEKSLKKNKVLSDTILTQEKKTNDFVLLQSKYDELIKGLNFKPKGLMKVEFCFGLAFKPDKKQLVEEMVSQVGIESKKSGYKYSKLSSTIFEDAKSNENIYNLNRKLTVLITEKGRVEEELLEYKEKSSKLSSQIILLEISNKELSLKNNELSLKAKELNLQNNELSLKNNELSLKNKELSFKISEISLNSSELINKNNELSLKNKDLEKNISNSITEIKKIKKDSLSASISSKLLFQQFSLLSTEIEKTEEVFTKRFNKHLNKISSLQSTIFYLKETDFEKNKNIQNYSEEISSLQKEKLKLLETRDKLIIQCNSQSEEIISLKLEQEESFLNKKDDQDHDNQVLKTQITALQLSENNLLQALKETTDKYTKTVEELSEKDSKIEEITAELSSFKFKQSTKSPDSADKYKEEIFNLKMKNIKLEKVVEEMNNTQLSLEEFNKIKTTYIAQITKVDEEKAAIVKKLKDCESNWGKERESLNKSLDSFTKQLAGANLEISNLKMKVKELNLIVKPNFHSSDEYRVVRVVEHEASMWFLIEDFNSHLFFWLSSLPFESTDELKDPLPNLIRERATLQKLNSELCAQNNKLKLTVSKIESIAKRENVLTVLEVLEESSKKKDGFSEFFKVSEQQIKGKGNKIGRANEIKSLAEGSEKGSIEGRKSYQSNKNSTFKLSFNR